MEMNYGMNYTMSMRRGMGMGMGRRFYRSSGSRGPFVLASSNTIIPSTSVAAAKRMAILSVADSERTHLVKLRISAQTSRGVSEDASSTTAATPILSAASTSNELFFNIGAINTDNESSEDDYNSNKVGTEISAFFNDMESHEDEGNFKVNPVSDDSESGSGEEGDEYLDEEGQELPESTASTFCGTPSPSSFNYTDVMLETEWI